MNKAAAFAKRRPGLTGAMGAMAAMAVAFGGYAASACTCVTPIIGTTTITTTTTTTTTTPPGTLGGVTSANLWLTAPGDAAGDCRRSASTVSYNTARTPNNHTCGGSQFWDNAVQNANLGDIIGVRGGIYNNGSQLVSYESRLKNTGCDPLGTWGSVNTNCIRFAPELGTQSFFNFTMEIHTGGIWFDGSATGTVTDTYNRTYSFRMPQIDVELDSPSNFPDHVTMTGVWAWSGTILKACQNCRLSQMQTGPRIHVDRAGQSSCIAPSNQVVDGTVGTGIPNPTDRSGLPSIGVPTGYAGTERIPAIQGAQGVMAANDVMDHIFYYYANNAADLACDPHDGGFFLRGSTSSVTLSDSIWQQNEGYDIEIQHVGDESNNNGITLQNDVFGQQVSDMRSGLAGSAGCSNFVSPSPPSCNGPTGDVDGSCAGAIQLDEPVANWTVRYNSFMCSGIAFNYDCGGCYTFTGQVYGNTGGHPNTCSPAGSPTFAYNVWTNGSPCSGTDTTSTLAALYTNTSISSLNTALKGSTGSTAADDFVTNATYKPAGLGSINGVARSGNYDAGSWAR